MWKKGENYSNGSRNYGVLVYLRKRGCVVVSSISEEAFLSIMGITYCPSQSFTNTGSLRVAVRPWRTLEIYESTSSLDGALSEPFGRTTSMPSSRGDQSLKVLGLAGAGVREGSGLTGEAGWDVVITDSAAAWC